MKRLTLEAICTATVRETWTIDVPDDFDLPPDDLPTPGDILRQPGTLFVSCEDDVDDERDRETTSVTFT